MQYSDLDFNQIQLEVSKNKNFRRELCLQNHRWFFTVYLNNHIAYPSASFHTELFGLTEDDAIDFIVIVAFRGSAKSTIMSLSYPIWAMLGKLQKKHIVLISQTQNQARQILANIRDELENNQLLVEDFGPFQEDSSQWSANSLVITKFGTKITSVSTGESIRGIRHRNFRPDLIICDDVESMESVKTQEGRDKTFNWFTSDVIPAGDVNTKIIIIGNLLHEDALVRRIQDRINENKLKGVYKEYPLIGVDGTPLWKGKFTSMEDIEQLEQKVGDTASFKREYMLQIVPNFDNVIHREWIHSYTEVPSYSSPRFMFGVIGVDLAISQKKSADKTSMVTVLVFGSNSDWKAYVLPNPINATLTFPETIQTIKALKASTHISTKLCIEKVAYQEAVIQQLEKEGVSCEGITISTDKRSRLAVTSAAIKSGLILFPPKNAEDLINQIVNFGTERHDDLVDAFSIAIGKVFSEVNKPEIDFYFV